MYFKTMRNMSVGSAGMAMGRQFYSALGELKTLAVGWPRESSLYASRGKSAVPRKSQNAGLWFEGVHNNQQGLDPGFNRVQVDNRFQ
jgi:hypothetical protein